MPDTRLAGQVVLVTGANAGIGAATARAFEAESARVAIHYLDAASDPPPGVEWLHVTPGRDAAEQLAGELAGSITVAMDLARDDAAADLFAEVEARLGPVDVLVNNAAHCEAPDDVANLTAAGLARNYRVNAVAPALLTAELARRTTAGRRPCVINISTDSARAFSGQLGYGSSKAAVEALTRAMALDLADRGIRVNAIAPGPIQTGWMDDEQLAYATSIVPMGRVGDPTEIADAVVFLASHQARFITGQVLQVAGGHAL